MRIAWFTPFSKKSAIGQCSSSVVERLTKSHEITVFASDLISHKDAWLTDVELCFLQKTKKRSLDQMLKTYDSLIYNLGDNINFHKTIYETAIKNPGIVILHDLVMHHFFASYYLDHLHDAKGYINEATFSHGEKGNQLAQRILDRTAGPVWDKPTMLEFHMAKSAVFSAYGIVVHSKYSKNALVKIANVPVIQIDFPEPRISQININATSSADVSPHNKIRLLTYGVINPNKMIAETVDAIGRNQFLRENVLYNIVGSYSHRTPYVERIISLIENYRLQESVHLLGYQPDEILYEQMQRSDIIINIRNPHFGESSWSLLEALFIGKPVIVWKHGYYDEFPDNVVEKVNDCNELEKSLQQLCKNETLRRTLGRRGLRFAKNAFKTSEYCEKIIDFIEVTRYNKPVLDLVDSMAKQLFDLRADIISPELVEFIVDEIAKLIDVE